MSDFKSTSGWNGIVDIAHRLWDDKVFLSADADAASPALAGQLLSALHLLDPPHDEQIEGVRAWLRSNELSESLEISLCRRGLRDALSPR